MIRDDDEHDQETAVPTSQLIFDGTLVAEKDVDQERRREPTAPEPDPIAQPFEVQSTSADLASNLTGGPVMQIPALEIETARKIEDRDKGTANQLDLEITKLRQAIAMINSSQAAG